MCGIFGMVFHSDPEPHKFMAGVLFSNLAAESAVRGTDATGLARIDTDGYISMYKNCLPSYDVVGFKRWWYPLHNISPLTLGLLGHTRWGTHGENVAKNAHPFRFDGVHRLVGTHNGVIRNYHKLGPDPLFDNDSANLFWRLAHTSRDAWGDVLTAVEGSYALAFAAGGEVHLARNLGSPCEFVYCPELDATVYASTDDILQHAFKAAKLPLSRTINILPSGYIYSYAPGDRMPRFEMFERGFHGYNRPKHHERRSSHKRTNWERGDTGSTLGKKAKITLAYGFSPNDNVQCDGCGRTTQWKDIYAPEDGNYYWCPDCTARHAERVFTSDRPAPILDSDCVVCADCGRETTAGECMIDQRAGGFVCSGCLMGTPVSPRVKHRADKHIMLECANCGYEELAAERQHARITYVQSIGEFLCHDCLEDPSIPFCAPQA